MVTPERREALLRSASEWRAALAQQAEPPELSPELAQKPLEQQAEPVRVPEGFLKAAKQALGFLRRQEAAYDDRVAGQYADGLSDALQHLEAQPEPQRVGLSEADRKDAERYRFIRDYDSPSNILAICRLEEIGWDGQFVIEHDPDAAIDAALAAKKGQPT